MKRMQQGERIFSARQTYGDAVTVMDQVKLKIRPPHGAKGLFDGDPLRFGLKYTTIGPRGEYARCNAACPPLY